MRAGKLCNPICTEEAAWRSPAPSFPSLEKPSKKSKKSNLVGVTGNGDPEEQAEGAQQFPRVVAYQAEKKRLPCGQTMGELDDGTGRVYMPKGQGCSSAVKGRKTTTVVKLLNQASNSSLQALAKRRERVATARQKNEMAAKAAEEEVLAKEEALTGRKMMSVRVITEVLVEAYKTQHKWMDAFFTLLKKEVFRNVRGVGDEKPCLHMVLTSLFNTSAFLEVAREVRCDARYLHCDVHVANVVKAVEGFQHYTYILK
eukprot:329021-Rhodomonas_salina.1